MCCAFVSVDGSVVDVALSGGRSGTSNTIVPLLRNVSMSTIVVIDIVAAVNDALGGVTSKGESGGTSSTLA